MKGTLLAFHGYTLNGSEFRRPVERLVEPLGLKVTVITPDAPLVCSPEAVDRFYTFTGMQRRTPPHCTWWDASDDGRVYEGTDKGVELVAKLCEQHGPVGILGFSQGAMFAALVAALSASGALPKIQFAVLIAGRLPRADALRAHFQEPIHIPSMHVWGENDPIVNTTAPELVEHFDAATREQVVWPGAHTLPPEPFAEPVRAFIGRHFG